MSGPQQTTAPVSGLTTPQRLEARQRAVQAAQVGLAHRAQMTYTEASPARGSGIANRRDSAKEEFPVDSDCSSFVTWCLWNGLHLLFGVGDVVNGESWTGGYTGTMLDHGKPGTPIEENYNYRPDIMEYRRYI